jgi:DNA-binding transcriptional regulator YiaG
VAAVIGVTADTVCYWENNRVKPSRESDSKIVKFLTQDERPSPGDERRRRKQEKK